MALDFAEVLLLEQPGAEATQRSTTSRSRQRVTFPLV